MAEGAIPRVRRAHTHVAGHHLQGDQLLAEGKLAQVTLVCRGSLAADVDSQAFQLYDKAVKQDSSNVHFQRCALFCRRAFCGAQSTRALMVRCRRRCDIMLKLQSGEIDRIKLVLSKLCWVDADLALGLLAGDGVSV